MKDKKKCGDCGLKLSSFRCFWYKMPLKVKGGEVIRCKQCRNK